MLSETVAERIVTMAYVCAHSRFGLAYAYMQFGLYVQQRNLWNSSVSE